jgi:beta-glucanase (GH16 family)
MACCGELQWYSDAEGRDGNYLVHDGTLSIVAREETVMAEGYEHPYTSGLIQTRGSFAQEHGYFEIRAQVPAGQGLWPAFWLLPADGSKPWEVDIFEILGDEPDTVHMTLHYPNAEGEPRVDEGKFGPLDGSPDFSRDYHTFAVRWDPERIVWYVDGVERHRVEEAQKIPSGPFYLIANLAVGGGWPGPPDQTTNFPARYEIDYVRVYRRV